MSAHNHPHHWWWLSIFVHNFCRLVFFLMSPNLIDFLKAKYYCLLVTISCISYYVAWSSFNNKWPFQFNNCLTTFSQPSNGAQQARLTIKLLLNGGLFIHWLWRPWHLFWIGQFPLTRWAFILNLNENVQRLELLIRKHSTKS